MELWNAHSIRAVWFVSGMVDTSIDNVFRSFFGADPDTVQTNKVPTAQNPFLATATADIDNLSCEMFLQPGRFEIAIQKIHDAEEGGFPSFPIDRGLKIISRGIMQIRSLLPPSVRLALVTQIVSPHDNYENALSEVSKLSGYAPDLEAVTDYLVQLNSRKNLRAGVMINRIVRWNVLGLQQYHLPLEHTSSTGPIPSFQQEIQVASSLSLDLNTTVADLKIYGVDEQIDIFSDMIIETLRLARDRTAAALRG